MSRHRAVLIAGPTASGKSGVAVALAERLGGVVVNADSMQVYRDLRVLTARPEESDLARARHELYGFVPASSAYSVGRWVEDTRRVLAGAERAGLVPIITGGTGLYFKALLEGLSPVPDIPARVRERWRRIARESGGQQLHELLRTRDPVMAERLRPSDPQRLVRALEVVDATGRSLAEWQQEPGRGLVQPGEVLPIVISPPREALAARIAARAATMLESGALDEVEALANQNLDPALPAMRALGVAPLMAHISGRLELEEAAERLVIETRQYAKRQTTWLKRNMITWKWVETKDSQSLFKQIFAFIDV